MEVTRISDVQEGYYWARHHDGTTFIVLRQDGSWWTVGVPFPIDGQFKEWQIMGPVKRMDN